jgi:hypothetical protein
MTQCQRTRHRTRVGKLPVILLQTSLLRSRRPRRDPSSIPNILTDSCTRSLSSPTGAIHKQTSRYAIIRNCSGSAASRSIRNHSPLGRKLHAITLSTWRCNVLRDTAIPSGRRRGSAVDSTRRATLRYPPPGVWMRCICAMRTNGNILSAYSCSASDKSPKAVCQNFSA